MELLRQGVIGEDVGDLLLEEVDLKLEQVERGETAVRSAETEDGYEEFWWTEVAESSLDFPVEMGSRSKLGPSNGRKDFVVCRGFEEVVTQSLRERYRRFFSKLLTDTLVSLRRLIHNVRMRF